MLMDIEAKLQSVRDLVALGVLRPVDLGFAEYLLDQDPAADTRILLAAAILSTRYGAGHVCLDLSEWIADPTAYLDYQGPHLDVVERIRMSIQQTSPTEFITLFKTSKLVGSEDGAWPLIFCRDKLYLTRNFVNEATVATKISERLEIGGYPPFEHQEALSELFSAQSLDRVGPDTQKIAAALASRGRFLILTGGPGTGKTYTVVRMMAILLSQNPTHRILLGAPTGKAAARLTESILSNLDGLPEAIRVKIPTKATTLHQMLRSEGMSRTFRHHELNPLHADVVIVDEASMVDLELMAALVRAVPNRCKLILVGDKDQLSSVEAGYVLGELCHALDQRGYSNETLQWIQEATSEALPYDPQLRTDRLAQQTVWLRHSIRFSGQSGIGRLAEAVHQEDPHSALSLFQQQPAMGDLNWIETREPDARLVDALCFPNDQDLDLGLMAFLRAIQALKPCAKGPDYDRQLDAIFDAHGAFQILCALREGPFGVHALNRWVERRLEQKGFIPPFHQRSSGWYAGRPVMLTRNNYELGLMNGDVGITLPLSDPEQGSTRLRVVFRQVGATERYREILPTRITDIDTVYAMTVHKSQGSEFGHVVLMLPDAERAPILTKELLYTGITRAKTRLTLVGEKKEGILKMIERKTRRSGSLTDRFSED